MYKPLNFSMSIIIFELNTYTDNFLLISFLSVQYLKVLYISHYVYFSNIPLTSLL